MKRKILTFSLVSSLLTVQVSAQVDQKTAMAETNHGDEYYQFHSIDKDDVGYAGEKREKTYYISHQNNVIGEPSYFYMDYEVLESKDISGSPGDPKSDHYTKPSLVYTPRNGKGTLILDGIIYEFEDSKMDKLLSGEFKIKYIYVAKAVADHKDDKMGFMKRLKHQKNTGFILSMSKTIAETNHEEKIKAYLKEMKPIQEKATAGFTDEDKNNINKIKEIRQKKIDEINARVAKEQKILAERRKAGKGNSSSGGSNEVIIINETGRSVCLVQGRSSTSFTSKESFDCDEPVYYGVTTDGGRNCTSDKRGIAVSAGQCGKEVVLR